MQQQGLASVARRRYVLKAEASTIPLPNASAESPHRSLKHYTPFISTTNHQPPTTTRHFNSRPTQTPDEWKSQEHKVRVAQLLLHRNFIGMRCRVAVVCLCVLVAVVCLCVRVAVVFLRRGWRVARALLRAMCWHNTSDGACRARRL